MNIGPGELVVLLVNVALIVGLPAIVVLAALLLFRRIRDLEARVAKLETRQEATSGRPDGVR
jgi:hypothetical protein